MALRRRARREMKSEGQEKQGAKLQERCVLAAVQKTSLLRIERRGNGCERKGGNRTLEHKSEKMVKA